jgi:hypothetical protein
MKIITLWQPWASFIAWGWKTIETRTHDRFKGLIGERIGIHAGLKWDKDWKELACPYEESYLNVVQFSRTEGLQKEFMKNLPGTKGAILCTARVFDASWLSPHNSKSSLLKINDEHERFGLFLCDIKPITIPAKGKQGIWIYG